MNDSDTVECVLIGVWRRLTVILCRYAVPDEHAMGLFDLEDIVNEDAAGIYYLEDIADELEVGRNVCEGASD